MDKLRMQSLDKTKCNVEKLKELFPNAVTEVKGSDGKIDYAIDFDVLKQELSPEIVEGREERYQFTWPGKREAILLANSPIRATLRPCKEESVDFDNTQNLYIEGDNLDVLKLLQETYLGKVKMIYIDPPYNTGSDFIYDDDFTQSEEDYEDTTTVRDEGGNLLFQNTESRGRFHSDWCSMIYPRLKLAKDLLSDDGVIFISIDDHEVTNLKKMCDEIFGENNFVANTVWQSTVGSHTGENTIITITENILAYSKSSKRIINKEKFENNGKMTLQDEYYDRRGYYALDKLDSKRQASHYTDALNYPIECPDGTVQYPGGKDHRQDGWNYLWSKDKVKWGLANGFIHFKKDKAGGWKIYNKRYEKVDNCDNPTVRGNIFKNLLTSDFATTVTGSRELSGIFNNSSPFDYPKPTKLVKKFCELCGTKRSEDPENKTITILDFFSGSATTAHAVMQLNAEDGGHRKFIMVQLPEKCGEDSDAYKAGYENICEIGKERIRRAGAKILKENPSLKGSLDVGFRVLKLDSSNMEDVYYDPASTKQGELSIVNVKTDRTSLDLLFQAMLEFDKPLSSKIDETKICGKTVFKVDGDDLICCFDEEISDELVTEIAKLKPLYAVFRDSSFNGDSVCVNCGPIFAKFSPSTRYRIV